MYRLIDIKIMNNINNFSEIKNLKGYLINENGEVFSEKSGKTLKVTNGVVEVYVDGIKKKLNVAHLVLLTFVGNPDNAKRVRYKNGDRNDASLENIEWKTPTTTKKRAPQTKATTPRQKEISSEIKALERQMRKLKREEEALSKTNEMATIVKNNLSSIVEGIVKGENISVLTKRMLGQKLSRVELSKHIEKHSGVSLSDIVGIAKLYKAKPDYVKSIVKLYNGKMSNVVFNNVK